MIKWFGEQKAPELPGSRHQWSGGKLKMKLDTFYSIVKCKLKGLGRDKEKLRGELRERATVVDSVGDIKTS